VEILPMDGKLLVDATVANPIKFAGVLSIIRSASQRNKGPLIHISASWKSIPPTMAATIQGEVSLFGMNAKCNVKLSPTEARIDVSGKVFGLFDANIVVTGDWTVMNPAQAKARVSGTFQGGFQRDLVAALKKEIASINGAIDAAKRLAEQAAEKIRQAAKRAKEAARRAAQRILGGIRRGANKVRDGVKRAGGKLKNLLGIRFMSLREPPSRNPFQDTSRLGGDGPLNSDNDEATSLLSLDSTFQAGSSAYSTQRGSALAEIRAAGFSSSLESAANPANAQLDVWMDISIFGLSKTVNLKLNLKNTQEMAKSVIALMKPR